MQVYFQSGESFDGPWDDDPAIPNDTTAYRRLIADWVEAVSATDTRVRSSAFQPHRDSNSISVTLGDVAEELGVDPQEMALGEHAAEYGLATFTVGDARELGFMIRRVPLSVDPGHAMLFASDPTTGECPHKNRCRKLGRNLSRLANVVRVPPGV